MSRKEKVSRDLVDLSLELSAVDTDGQATLGQVRDALRGILKGVPRESSEVHDILALALDALETAVCRGVYSNHRSLRVLRACRIP